MVLFIVLAWMCATDMLTVGHTVQLPNGINGQNNSGGL